MAEGLVMMLGGAAGGAAGSALAKMFEPNPTGPDTSIPGVTKAVLQKGGKNNKELSTAQVDPSGALAYFQKAADDYKSNALTGLGMYGASVQKAVDAVNSSTTAANQSLTDNLGGIVKTGNAATNEYLAMMGLPTNDGSQLSSDQIQAKLEATPGYQFSLDQGTQAVARSGAAAGMLNSGNTLAAAQQFGQGLAQQTYQGYLGNLQPLMNAGNTAASQIATGTSSNNMNQGSSLAQLYGNVGSAALTTYGNIGSAYSNADTNAGNTWYQAAIANMNQQNSVLDTMRQQEQTRMLANNSNALQLGYLNLAENKFNYTQQNNVNYAAGAAAAAAGGAV